MKAVATSMGKEELIKSAIALKEFCSNNRCCDCPFVNERNGCRVNYPVSFYIKEDMKTKMDDSQR